MKAPNRKIWLCPDGADLEVIVLGDAADPAFATLVITMRQFLETWHGLERVRPLMMGVQLVGFVVGRSAIATHTTAIAETFLALRSLGITWQIVDPQIGRDIEMGTW